MAAYAALVSVKTCYSTILHYFDVALPPEVMSMCESAYKELNWLQDFVERLDSRSRSGKRMSAWLQRIPETLAESRQMLIDATEIDELVEASRTVLETLKNIKEELREVEEIEAVSLSSSSSSSKMIGLGDERSKLKAALVDDYTVEEPLFLVHGMAGIGKTMLAREIYEDLDISEWFECRAWVAAGNEWTPQQITEAILSQLDPEKLTREEDVKLMLKECLDRKRWLIVVDDVWDYDIILDCTKTLLPTDIQGSRLLFTSRIIESNFDGYLLEKRLLNKEESWDLLRHKVFAGGSCPPQLGHSGKKISEKCDGLPLTIITVANLLSNAEESLWIDVAEKKKHRVFIDAYDQISEVLHPSFKELQDGFKLFFLYMGVFPLKYEIHRSKLINLWSAENTFLQFEEKESPYVIFLKLIEHLNYRSLVMVYERSASSSLILDSSFQPISTCGLHSSWWHFCQTEARRINFFHALDCPEDAFEEVIKDQSRLSIHNNVLFALKHVYNSIEENCASTAQSLLCFGPYNQYMVPLCFGLKFLQRLDALNIRFYDFPLEVLELAKLLYLALTCNKQLPPSISKLEKIQYLIVHPHLSIKSCGDPTFMPVEIWELEELKHLEVLGSDLPDPDGDKSLEMLSTLLDVSTASCSVLDKLPNLKKLRIRIVLTPEAPDSLCCFHHISNLGNISSMTCIVENPHAVSPVASFPAFPYELIKLSLSGLGYPWEKMKVIAASLDSLRMLELQCNAFQGPIWEVEKTDFINLKSLLLEGLDLVKLKAEPGIFSNLNHVSIKHCYKLEEIQLGDFANVSRIEVVDSNPLVEKSIKQIMLENREFPNHFSVHCSWKSVYQLGSQGQEARTSFI